MTMRCSDCSINYPMGMAHCQVCQAKLDYMQKQAYDEDWRDQVAAATKDDEPAEDKVAGWRFAQLLKAGYAVDEASILSARRDVDLHHATTLRARTDLAFEILA